MASVWLTVGAIVVPSATQKFFYESSGRFLQETTLAISEYEIMNWNTKIIVFIITGVPPYVGSEEATKS